MNTRLNVPKFLYLPGALIFIAVILLCGTIAGYTVFASTPGDAPELVPNHTYLTWEASEDKVKQVDLIERVADETSAERSLRLRRMKLGVKDIKKPTFYLNSPTIITDLYKPVKFMMREHAIRMGNDCAKCHHKTPAEVPPGLKGLRPIETMRCESCHQWASIINSSDERLSLKAAYHQRCIGCHKKKRSDKAPVYCAGCHRRHIPKHEELFTVKGVPDKVEATQMTRLCLDCHPRAGEEMIRSAHYNWGGPVSAWTVTESGVTMTGKGINSVNNQCISPYGDWGQCTTCHAGYGAKEEGRDKWFSKNPEYVDCLICHAEEDTYGKDDYGMPDEDSDLVWVAGLVGSTSRAACGFCHFDSGGGNGRKGQLCLALNHPERTLDVHMGGEFNMTCADCHKGREHKIPGRHSSVGVDEGSVECTDCHTSKPHADNLLAKHLDRHVDHVKCSVCHIPKISREAETRFSWDWRDVGKGDKVINNERGNPIYLPEEGTFKWRHNQKPHYSWDNGFTKRYLVGDKIHDMTSPVIIGRNLGDRNDPDSKIGPFKIFRSWQPADIEYRYLIVPKLSGEDGVWETKKWEGPITAGMKAVGLPFSGKFTFVETELRFRPRHEIAPKEKALTCVQCHSSALNNRKTATDTCRRCHYEDKARDIKYLITKEIEYVITKGKGRNLEYMPWKNLGYKIDPIKTEGRFSSFTNKKVQSDSSDGFREAL